ncbi:MAG: polyamine aminopropyltransferase, partial [Polyangiaceae bacterium]
MSRQRVWLLYLSVLTLSACGLVYELALGAVSNFMLGDTVTQLSIVTGVYLSAMGLGAYLARYAEDPARAFVECQLGAALVGGLGVPIVYIAFASLSDLHAIIYALAFGAGVLVGAELPLVLRVLRRRVAFRDLVAGALGIDYIGALIGALIFGVLALPRLGALRSGILFGGIHALSALWTTSLVSVNPRALRIRAVVVLAVLSATMIGSSKLVSAADEALFADPVIFAQQTQYQRIAITRGHGGVNLFLDGNLQFSEVDEHRYHEALVHPLFAVAKKHARVLVLGGGDGLATREILKYPDVQSVTLVDLDPAMTKLSQSLPYLRALNRGSLSDPRVTVINRDAMTWLMDQPPENAFDAVVVDFPDPNNFALGKLYTVRFYKLLRAHMTDDAVAVVQSTSPLVA